MNCFSTRFKRHVASLRQESSHSHDYREDYAGLLPQGPRKYWEVLAHCETVLLPQPRPEITFDNPVTNYHYQRLTSSARTVRDVKLISQQGLYNIVLEQAEVKFQDLCRLLVAIASCRVKCLFLWHVLDKCEKPFKGPLQSDIVLDDPPRIPYTYNPGGRQYLRDLRRGNGQKLQKEISKRSLNDVISAESLNKKTALKSILSRADPFEASHKLSINSQRARVDLNYFLSHHRGSVKNKSTKSFISFAEQFETSRNHSRNNHSVKVDSNNLLIHQRGSVRKNDALKRSVSYADQSEASGNISCNNQSANVEKLERVRSCLTHSISDEMVIKRMKEESVSSISEYEEHVFSQADAGIQCQISQDLKETDISLEASSAHHITTTESHREARTCLESRAMRSEHLLFCENYLKYYENTKIKVDVLRDIYMISLKNLTHLTQLAVNYCLLADGTGDALLSIGSVANGRLKHLKLLCEADDIPSPTHQLYEEDACHAIPDLAWQYVKDQCPDLKVHIVFVSMSAYDFTKRFVTRSMPLSSFCMENGFCPTLSVPELTIFCTLESLWLQHAETLEHVNLTLWHSTGRIDNSLVKLIQKTQLLSFEYYGPLQNKASAVDMCDAALYSPKFKNFKLMIQGDPCFSHNAQHFTNHLYSQYRHRFQDKSIHFTLGTFSS